MNEEGWIEGHALGRQFEEIRMTETLLGAAMRQTETIDELISCGFSEDDLDDKHHRAIWRIALNLHQKGIVPEPAIVEAKLLDDGLDENKVRDFISGCMRSGVEVAHPRLASFLQYIRNKVALRRLGDVGKRAMLESNSDNATPSIIAATVNAEIEKILMGAATADGATSRDIAQIIEDARMKRQVKSTKFYSFGHPVLDNIMHGGGQQGTIILVSAGIGVGKSTAARTFASNFARKKIPTLYFSFEMGRDEIALCLQQIISGVCIDDSVLTAREHSAIIEAREEIETWPLFIEDRQMVTVEDVTTRIHQYVKRHGVEVVLVDYIQDIEFSTRFNREDMNYRHISKTLRRCVDSLGILLIEMAQEKGIEETGGKKFLPKRATDDIVADSRQFMKDCHIHISLKRHKLDERISHVTQMTVTKNRRFGSLGTVYSAYDHKSGLMLPADERGEILSPQARVEIKEIKTKYQPQPQIQDDDYDINDLF
jgi:replicative DNA helicase